MRNKFFFCAMFLFVVSLFVFLQPTAYAAPLAICVSTSAGGNWTDTSTWAFCTGSNPPASTADIYIEGPVTMAGQSAANVTIDSGGTLTVTGASSISGNLFNNGTLTHLSGTLTLNGTIVQSIGGSSALTFNNLTVNNAAGVTLNQNASVSGTLTFTSGDLNTGANMLTLTGANVTGAGGGDVVGYSKRADAFSPGTPYAFNSPNTLINFSSLSVAPTDITINLVKSTPTGFTRALPRQYTITATGSPVFTATLQLHYKSSEVTGSISETNIMPWRYNTVTGRWVLQSGSVVSNGDNSYIQATNVTGFSLWALTDNGAPTAITLSTFTASGSSTQNNPVMIGLIGVLMLAISGGGWMFTHR
jgi:hypothetical protein